MNRWEPESRAGAIAVRSKRAHDLQATKAIAESVSRWASYQNLEGEADNVETSPITGNYDWKAYLHEEATLARKREDARKPRKSAERAQPAPAPSVFYA